MSFGGPCHWTIRIYARVSLAREQKGLNRREVSRVFTAWQHGDVVPGCVPRETRIEVLWEEPKSQEEQACPSY